MKSCTRFLILASLTLVAPSVAWAEDRAEQASAAFPVCGLIVGKAYKSEVEADTTKPDKYKHCALSCVMTLYCGPTDSMSVGIMKEIYDALGFGTPDWKDIEADKVGIKIGMKQISNADFSRDSCYRSCSTVYR